MARLALLLLLFFTCSSPLWATPKDVRRVLVENGFAPRGAISGPVVACVEERMEWKGIARLYRKTSRPELLSEYDYRGPGVRVLSANEAEEFAALLADRQTYSPAWGGKACGFHPDLEVSVPGRNSEVFIQICFGCAEIWVGQGKVGAKADIDRGRNRILRWAKEVFPNEWSVQKIQTQEDEPTSIREALDWAQMLIPDDPLLKSLLSREPKEITDEELEELDDRCTAEQKSWGDEGKSPHDGAAAPL